MIDLRKRVYVATFQDEAAAVAGEYGLGLEFNQTCISEALDKENREALLAEMRALKGRDYILHGPFTEIYPAAIDRRAREMARERLEEACEVCKALGVKRMVVHNGWLPFIYFKEWQAEKGAAFWQEFLRGKPADFFLYIENVLEDEPLMLADMMKRIKDPRINLCLDVGHAHAMTTEEFPLQRWIKELAPYIGHFHLHNNHGRSDEHAAFDCGTLDMQSVIETAVRCCRRDATFTIEARDTRACARWLHERGYI